MMDSTNDKAQPAAVKSNCGNVDKEKTPVSVTSENVDREDDAVYEIVEEAEEEDEPVYEAIDEVAVEQEPVSKPAEECSDPYFYTKRDEFTSEIFKIELEGLPRVIGYAQLKTLLTKKMNLKPHKIKVIDKIPNLVFVTFRCEEDREQALKTICNFVWKGRKLFAKKANPMADPLVKKRKTALSQETSETPKKAKTDEQSQNHDSVAVLVKNAITPLWNISYEEQLKGKQAQMRSFLEKMADAIKATYAAMPGRSMPNSSQTNCPLLPIIPSPITTKYRNKCEFNIGLHPDTEQPTVGFRLSSYKEGSMSVGEASHCSNIPDIMIKATEVFQEYIRASPLAVFNPENYTGYWRQLTARTSCNGHLLLIVVLHPQNLSEEQLEDEKEKLKDFFSKSAVEVTSLYMQKFIKKMKDEPPLEHISGQNFIEEELMGLKFRISPDAFFQVNTDGAQVLYNTVLQFANLTKKTTLLDLCCGTGTIGIALAKYVAKVYGVEVCNSAVRVAWYNAEVNGIENVEFSCEKVEDVIFSIINKSAKDNQLVAILDPPRAGVGNKVIKALRGEQRVKRVVYMSCSPQLAMTNLVDLCRPTSNSYRLAPFRPVKAVTLDMFPQTVHCELILLFERD